MVMEHAKLAKSQQGTTAQGKQGKWPKKFPVRENTGNLEILPKHREHTGKLVCSSCNFLDSKRYFDICRENPPNFVKLDKSVFVCNSHKSRKLAQGKFAVRRKKQGKHREFENEI